MSSMLSSVLFFGLLTAAVEFMLLYKFVPLNWLRNRGVQGMLHFGVAALNLAIHWGTIVGTMTAITALFVSFLTVPLVIATLTFTYNWRRPNGTPR